MNDQLQPVLDLLAGKLGWGAGLLSWIAASRLVMKFFNARLQGLLTARVAAAAVSPDAGERQDWEMILSSRCYRVFNFAVDLAFSLKLPVYADFLRAKSDSEQNQNQ